MLWLDPEKSLSDWRPGDAGRVLHRLDEVRVMRLAGHSPTSSVFFGLAGGEEAVLKVYHPDVGFLKSKNESAASEISARLGVQVPELIFLKRVEGLWVSAFRRIPEASFRNFSGSSTSVKNAKVAQLVQMLQMETSKEFGPLANRDLVPSLRGRNYLDYLSDTFLFYVKRAREKRLIERNTTEKLIKYHDRLLSGLTDPKDFFLSHGDLSGKHLFLDLGGRVGAIDWEEAMFMDGSFDHAVWLVRTGHFDRGAEPNSSYLRVHLIREYFVQIYYKKPRELSKLWPTLFEIGVKRND
ncbi:MAG: phosphotransferase [Patescibacteria group bacterium]